MIRYMNLSSFIVMISYWINLHICVESYDNQCNHDSMAITREPLFHKIRKKVIISEFVSNSLDKAVSP